jgi:hypothetical protein
MTDKLVTEAQRQLDATQGSGTPIEWRVVDEEMALRISSILDARILSPSARQRITVVYTPLSDIQG